jgi:signal transduction histidine kinase
MIERLEAAVERERRFTGDASHELRAPLAVIRAETTLALEHDRDPDNYRRVLQTVDEQAREMQDLVSALLMLARLESTPFEQEPVDLRDVVEQAVEGARTSVVREDVAIECTVAPALETSGSDQLLTRAVRNILENALKHSAGGGVVRVAATATDASVHLTVEDSGEGIASEHRTRIFEPFYQVAPSRTPGTSHGLGLAICRRIVEAHGGGIEVEAVVPSGARFIVTLPRLIESGYLSTEVPRA